MGGFSGVLTFEQAASRGFETEKVLTAVCAPGADPWFPAFAAMTPERGSARRAVPNLIRDLLRARSRTTPVGRFRDSLRGWREGAAS